MPRFLIPTLAAAVVAGGAWLAPAPAAAQNYDQNYNQNPNRSPSYSQNQGNYRQNRNNQSGATAWGDPWLNENDFDYNRRHWLPGPGDTRQGYGDSDRDQGRYGRNNDNYDRQGSYGQDNWNDRDQGRYGRNDYNYPPQGNYNQNNGNDRSRNYYGNYDNRYNPGYDRYNDNSLGRNYRPDNRYQYDDDDYDR